MENPYILPLSLVVFLPSLGALVLALLPKDRPSTIRAITLAVTIATFALTVWIAIPRTASTPEASPRFEVGQSGMQAVFNYPWIRSFNIEYFMGMDGISFPLLILTSFISLLAMITSWNITKHVKAYCILFLLLETGMLGVFLALDFFLFYVFWEVMLLPMYFLIGVWGGPRKEYAAIKFFLFTLVGSVLMLIAILMLYFTSDLRVLTPRQLADAHVIDVNGKEKLSIVSMNDGRLYLGRKLGEDAKTLRIATLRQEFTLNKSDIEAIKDATQGASEAAANEIIKSPLPVHTFNILALQKIGQMPDSRFNAPILWGKSIAWWCFLLLFIGFAIKVPAVPVHTWLPDAHVEAPTPISMILAGVLLKMGGYGIIRICYPICPLGGFELAYFVCFIGVLSMIYGAFAAMAQKDFKRLVAYSSVSHMGYVVLGFGVWSAVGGFQYDWQYWSQGMNGAMFQMLAHGISSAGMFFMVGVLYDRVHHRNLDEFGGLFARMPLYSGLAFAIFFAGLGLPGLCGFIGEVLVTLSVWNYNHALAVLSASVVILTAGYILWTLQRVYLGAEYKGPHGDHLTPITPRELTVAIPLVIFAIVFGVYPQAIFNYMTPSVNQSVQQLAEWTKDVHDANKLTTSKTATVQETPATKSNSTVAANQLGR